MARTTCQQARTPSAFGTSPKYDNANLEFAFRCYLVVFGGGWVGVVEVDGDIHDLQQEEDAKREKALREMGLSIVRFQNDEVLKNLLSVVGRIKELALTR